MTESLWVIEEYAPDFKSQRPRADESRVQAHRDHKTVAYSMGMEATGRALRRIHRQDGEPATCLRPTEYVASDAPSDRAVWVVGLAKTGWWESAYDSESAARVEAGRTGESIVRYVPKESH